VKTLRIPHALGSLFISAEIARRLVRAVHELDVADGGAALDLFGNASLALGLELLESLLA
jgi:hypothetical protein